MNASLSMSSISTFANRYALVLFFLLAIGFSWAFPFFFALGPFLAALLMAILTGGLAGLKDLIARCLRWRVGIRWYVAAILVPAFIGLVTIALTIVFGMPMPAAGQLGPWYTLLLLIPTALVDAPLFEDSGWRGFAMPRFPRSLTPLVNTLILGLLLVAWHLPRALSEPSITLPYLLATFGSAVITNWVYYNARESALLAIVYHTIGNAFGLFFAPLLGGADLIRYFWLLAAVNWLAAVIIIFATGQDLKRQQGMRDNHG